MRELERRLSPEFRNRLDDVIVFAPLTREEAAEVARIQLDRVIATATSRGKELVITPEALDEIVRQGHSLAYGARFLKRVIDERVKIPLSRIWSQAARFRVIAVQNEIVVEATDSESAVIPETLAS